MNKIYAVALVLGVLVGVSSCELEDRRYTGPLFVEFSPDQYGQSASPSGIVKTAPDVGIDVVGVQLIGLAQSEALNVNFRMADQVFYIIGTNRYVAELPDNLDPSQYQTILSTAQYGVDYTFSLSSGSVPAPSFDEKYGRGSFTVSPNSQFGAISLSVLQKSGAQLFFVLEDSDNLIANKPTGLLRYSIPIDKIVILDEPFASDPCDRGWTEIDRDGDGYSWTWFDNPLSITSDSYLDGGIGAVLPENYLISPLVTIPSDVQNVTLAFSVASGASNDYREQYMILISENEITYDNCRNAEVLQDWTVLTDANSAKKFTDVAIDLNGYKGKSVYLAFLHGNCTDQYYILMRNLSIYSH
jgi:hypothetical protein